MYTENDLRQVAVEMKLGSRPKRGRKHDFSRFVARTNAGWVRMAERFLRRWDCPPSYSAEDVKQDMIVSALRSIEKFDATRSPKDVDSAYADWIVFNAYDGASKALHAARGANRHGNRGKNRSRYPIPFTSLGDSFKSDERSAVSDDDTIDTYLDIMKACISDRERCILKALIESESMTAAADVLYDAIPTFHLFNFESRAQARRFVRSVCRDLRERIAVIVDAA